jgi:hypothetical protein
VPLTIQNNGTGNSFVVNDVASDTTPFVIDAAGLVGIGGSPSVRFDVIDGGATSIPIRVRNSAGITDLYTLSTGDTFLANQTTGKALTFGTEGTERMRISSAGVVTIGGNPINGTWATYTPTFTNFTLGNGTINQARWVQVGKKVCVNVVVTLGSTSSVTGLIQVSTPTTLSNGSNNNNQVATFVDTGTGMFLGSASNTSGTAIGIYANNAGGTYVYRSNTSATVPMTWASTDAFAFYFTYEAS